VRPSTAEIRAAFADALAAFYTDWQVSAYLKASPTPPCIDVMPAGVDYDSAMDRGSGLNTYIVRAIVTFGKDVSAQAKLDTLLDLDPSASAAMKNAIEADRTLGGVVESLNVVSASEYKVYGTVNSGQLVGVEWTVVVVA
jgi:hypothetical protein